jgi:NADH dehydrogenase
MRKAKNVRVEMAEVSGFDLEKRVVHAHQIPGYDLEVPYDTLIVAGGAGQSYFGHDEFALHAPGMKTLDDAIELRRRILGALEMAETTKDEHEQRHWLTMVVVGAGPTGVEIAGQIRELATRSLRGEFRAFNPSTIRVIVVDGGREPLATFGDNLSERAALELENLGVELMMNARVTGVDAMGVDVETVNGTERINAHTVVWAAGVQASPLAKMLAEQCHADVDRSGRIATLPDLTLPGHPEVFAVGDMVTLNGYPGVAEVAMQGSLHAAYTVVRRLRGDDRATPYKYRDVGSVAVVGRFRAICSVRGLHLSGLAGWMVWMFVHLAFLNGWGSRTTTMLRWVRWLVGHNRAERVFSRSHTGGDLSAPEAARAVIQPTPYPANPVNT